MEKNCFRYKNRFGINNLQWLMCHKTKPNQTKRKKSYYYVPVPASKLFFESIQLIQFQSQALTIAEAEIRN